MMRAGVVVFLGVFGLFASAAWCGCSSGSPASTLGEPDAAADTSSCKLDPFSGSVGDCTCAALADFCANGSCPATLAYADDAGTWASAGPQPNCYISQSTNACSGQIEVIRGGGVDTSDTYIYDQATGALTFAARVINLRESCGGRFPTGKCDDVWTLAPIFGTFDGGMCYGVNANAGIADAGSD
jgi:hypothetical protein